MFTGGSWVKIILFRCELRTFYRWVWHIVCVVCWLLDWIINISFFWFRMCKFRSMSFRGMIVFSFILVFVLMCLNIYIYLGGLVTATPFAGMRNQRDLLMEIGNNSATNVRPVWKHHERFMTMCTMVKNEARYIREWVEFHSLVGVDQFIIFDNDSTDSLEAALKGTIANVSIVKWPPALWTPGNPHEEKCQGYKDGVYLDDWAFSYCQIAAFHECIYRERGHSRWIAGVDVDEYFMPRYDDKRLYTLKDVLKAYDHIHGISLDSFAYGTNHLQTPIQPGELIIETHTLRGDDGACVKEFVDPFKVETYPLVHWSKYHNPLWNLLFMRYIPRHRSLVRYNHYPYRSVLESRHKVFKNMNPGIFQRIDKWDKVDVEDLYLIPMVPLIRKRLAGEKIWIRSLEQDTD